jgi:hypothetical protein
MRKRIKKDKHMSLDQQISLYEDRISQLEQMKRILILQNNIQPGSNNGNSPDHDLSRINVDLDESYEYIAILKIRKMMGF